MGDVISTAGTTSPAAASRSASQPAPGELAASIAREVWSNHHRARRARLRPRPAPHKPLLLLFAGTPLSGKSAIAKGLTKAARTEAFHIENDALRARVAARLGRPPTQDSEEHHLTYLTAWRLIQRALTSRPPIHAIHDATNLDERGRRPAYRIADQHGVDVFVIFVRTHVNVLDERAERLDPDRRNAHRKYRDRRLDPTACTRPWMTLDGGETVEANIERLRGEPWLAPLWHRDP